MQYLVIADDGTKYGPADISLLNQWIRENRIRESTILELVSTAERVAAGSVIGLEFQRPEPSVPPLDTATFAQPPSPAGGYYARPPLEQDPQAAKDAQTALLLGVVGLVICAPCSFAAIYYANRAKQAGSQNYLAGLILGWLNVALIGVAMLIFLIAFGYGMSTGFK